MNYNFNGKTIRIPDKEIENNMKVLELTQDESIQMWLEDEGYLDNEEQKTLEQKAKEARITATIHGASAEKPKKKTQKERVRKEDPTKEMIITRLAEVLQEIAEDVQITNIGKLISFKLEEDAYELDLKRKRKAKK